MSTNFHLVRDNCASSTRTAGALDNLTADIAFLVPVGEGAQFGTLGAGQIAIVTLWSRSSFGDNPKSDPKMELAELNFRSGDSLTLHRPSPQAHAGICDIAIMPTKAIIEQLQTAASALEAAPVPTMTDYSAVMADSFDLSTLGSGILAQTVTGGVATLMIATLGTSFYGPGFVTPVTDGGTGGTTPSAGLANLGGEPALKPVDSFSANFTLLAAHKIVRVDTSGGAVTVTLPPASANVGRCWTIYNLGSNALTLSPVMSDTVVGTASTNTANSRLDIACVTSAIFQSSKVGP